jgi:hypothetical protein
MATSEELARFHIETAIKLVGRDNVIAMVTATATAGRGRRPGAASDDTRCQWKLTDGTQCKNAHNTEKVYCKIHSGKVDLIDLIEF